MAQGTLRVALVNAKGLENSDYLRKMDPYVILSYAGRKQNSKIAAGEGSQPEWNEIFTFDVNSISGGTDLHLKIMDSDCGTEDDCVGEAIIPLEPVFGEGRIPAMPYNVVKDQEFRGQIKLGLSFHKVHSSDQKVAAQEESYGGWTESH